MKSTLIRCLGIILCWLLLVPITYAAETSIVLDSAPLDSHNFPSLQRGAKLYVNYCIGCHSMKYQRYSRLVEDLGVPEDVVQANLAFGGKLFAPMLSAMEQEQARKWFSQTVPPDLSLSARARGSDWLYTYLKSFYRDPARPNGWNNSIYENVAMPNVLHSLQGSYVREEDGTLRLLNAGRLQPAEFDTVVADLVNFITYAAEPSRTSRLRIGYAVMIFLAFLLPLTYFLYREYWRDID